MALPEWLEQTRAAADIVLSQFGESVDLLPWEPETDSPFSERGPDTTRSPRLAAVALFHQGVGEEDKALSASIAVAEAYYVIDQSYIEACGLTQGDRLVANDRGHETFEVVFVGKSAVRYPRVYVFRVKDPSTS